LSDLISFIKNQTDESNEDEDNDDEEEHSLMDTIRECCSSKEQVSDEVVMTMYRDLNRAFKMFYLQ